MGSEDWSPMQALCDSALVFLDFPKDRTQSLSHDGQYQPLMGQLGLLIYVLSNSS